MLKPITLLIILSARLLAQSAGPFAASKHQPSQALQADGSAVSGLSAPGGQQPSTRVGAEPVPGLAKSQKPLTQAADGIATWRAEPGSIVRSQHEKNSETVSVTDFAGCDPTGAADSTLAFMNAQGTGHRRVLVPPGTYKINNLRLKNGVVLQGHGTNCTFIQQANRDNPAILAKADALFGQLYGVGLVDVTVFGVNAPGAAAVKIEATAPWVVCFSEFRYNAGGDNAYKPSQRVSSALEIICTEVNEVFSCKFDIMCWGSLGTAFSTRGLYNDYRLESVRSADATALQDSSVNSTFSYLVSEGKFTMGGTNNIFHSPAIETIHGAYGAGMANLICFDITGTNHTLISPTLVAVGRQMAGYGFKVSGSGHTLINPRLYGSSITYGMWLAPGSSGTLINPVLTGSTYSIETISNQADLLKWSFVGDCSSALSKFKSVSLLEDGFSPSLEFDGTSAGITYSLQEATYQRIGNRIHFNLQLTLRSKGSSRGVATISGLPFPCKGKPGQNFVVSVMCNQLAIPAGSSLSAYISHGSSRLTLLNLQGDKIRQLDNSIFQNNTDICIAGSYPTNSN